MNNSRIRVLITSVGSSLGQGIFKALRKSEINCYVIGTDYVNWAPGLQWVDQSYILPDILKDKNLKVKWLEKLIYIIKTHDINVILIGQDYEIPIISEQKNYIENITNCKIVVSSKDVIDIGNDKWNTVKFLKDNNFNYPNSTLPNNIHKFLCEVDYPLIVKPRFGRRSLGVTKVHDFKELQQAIKITEKPLIQEFLDSKDLEYTCGVVYYNGEILTNISLRRYLKDGNTHIAHSENNEDIDRYVKNIVNRIKPFGPINLQLRIVERGPIIFEINPRFSGTTPIREIFGVNEVESIINIIVYNKTKLYTKIPGTVVRYFEEQLVS